MIDYFNVVPSVCNNYESVMWYCEERDLCVEREIEWYKLKRNYDELRERAVVGNYFDNNYRLLQNSITLSSSLLFQL